MAFRFPPILGRPRHPCDSAHTSSCRVGRRLPPPGKHALLGATKKKAPGLRRGPADRIPTEEDRDTEPRRRLCENCANRGWARRLLAISGSYILDSAHAVRSWRAMVHRCAIRVRRRPRAHRGADLRTHPASASRNTGCHGGRCSACARRAAVRKGSRRWRRCRGRVTESNWSSWHWNGRGTCADADATSDKIGGQVGVPGGVPGSPTSKKKRSQAET